MSPNFIIVGVARCGTTSLFHYLNQHPEIGMSKIKEPKYFSSLDLNLPQQGIGDETVFRKVVSNERDYDSLFYGLESFKVIGEGSSDYFYYHKTVIPRIKEKLGDVKIIICLRNPAERAFSAYSNLTRDSREKLEFIEGLEAENERITEDWDWMWYYKNGGLYSNALEHYQTEFTNVKVVFFDDLDAQPQVVVKEVCEFLNVASDIRLDVGTKFSHSGKPRSKLVAALTNRNNLIIFWAREIALKLIPRKYLEWIASKIFDKGDIDLKTLRDLKIFFRADIIKLQKLTNRNLAEWL
jgi:hypothetical protein